jgi:hypothetical protein
MPIHRTSPTIDALNGVIAILNRSLAAYLHSAHPYQGYGDHRDEKIVETLEQVVADQQRLVDRIATLVLEQGGRVDLGEFPMEFTGLHDLSASYLIKKLVEGQRRDLARLERLIERLRLAPLPRALAEESLGLGKGHLELFEELARLPGAPPKLSVVG